MLSLRRTHAAERWTTGFEGPTASSLAVATSLRVSRVALLCIHVDEVPGLGARAFQEPHISATLKTTLRLPPKEADTDIPAHRLHIRHCGLRGLNGTVMV